MICSACLVLSSSFFFLSFSFSSLPLPLPLSSPYFIFYPYPPSNHTSSSLTSFTSILTLLLPPPLCINLPQPTHLYPSPLPPSWTPSTPVASTPRQCAACYSTRATSPSSWPMYVPPHPYWFTSGVLFRIHSTYSSFSFAPASNVALDKTRTLNHQPVLRLEAAT